MRRATPTTAAATPRWGAACFRSRPTCGSTQDLTDGELFYIIEHGVRFTGMPGWSTGTDSGAASTWQLVQFISVFPQLTEQDLEQMQTLTPRSPAEIRQEIDEERFLKGGDVTPPATTTHDHSGAH